MQPTTDPSGIATYSIAGASTGYSLLWTAIVTAPMMAVLMGMCARIGVVSGKGLICAIKRRYDARAVLLLVLLVVAANTLNVAADYAGMAAALHLIVPAPETLLIAAFAAVLLAVEVFSSYRLFARIVEWLCFTLFAYLATAFLAHPNWMVVARFAVIPSVRWTSTWFTVALAVLGTTITPYLFVWQTAMYNEERRKGVSPIAPTSTADAICDMHTDVNTGMVYSNAMTFFIIVTTAATLGAAHLPIATAADAARALRPLAGDFASLLFAIGIVGTGLLSVPVIAGASAYALSDYFGWRDSLSDRPREAPLFYGVIALGLIGGTVMAALHLDVMRMLLYSAVFNGVAVVPLIFFVIRLSGDEAILGGWTASAAARSVGWVAFGLLALTSATTMVMWFLPLVS